MKEKKQLLKQERILSEETKGKDWMNNIEGKKW
jgi:hypothetical protein